MGGNPFVAVYSRVHVANPTGHTVTVDPEASPSLIPLDEAPDTVPPHHAVDHDYVVLSDRFGSAVRLADAQTLAAAGGFDQHFAHMRAFWNAQLAGIAQISVPTPHWSTRTRAASSRPRSPAAVTHLDTGVNGYESEFSHDVIGILTNLFTQGYFTDAHALLTEARNVVGSQGQYVDGLWTYAVPWAVYLLKTGDRPSSRQNFAIGGPLRSRAAEHRGRRPRHCGGPHGTAGHHGGHRTTSTPRGTGPPTTTRPSSGWPPTGYVATATRRTRPRRPGRRRSTPASSPRRTPCSGRPSAATASTTCPARSSSPTRPTAATTRRTPTGPRRSASEAGPGRAPCSAPRSADPADADRRHLRLRLRAPARTAPAGHDRAASPTTTTRAATTQRTASAGLASMDHRDQGILNYEFMLANSQSGPLSWWESSGAPDPRSPWVGRHPATGQGSSPHAWGMAGANKVLLDSLVAQTAAGALVVGRGVPPAWLRRGAPISVTNFPTTAGRRAGPDHHLVAAARSPCHSSARRPTGPVLFQLPSFIRNIAAPSPAPSTRQPARSP